MNIDKSEIKRILVITLSNVGDVILTTPVVKTLVLNFPDARLDVMVGPHGAEVFEKDPEVSKVIIYDKHASVLEKQRLSSKLRHLQYDLVVDLRNTIFGLLLGPKYRTSTIQILPKDVRHRVDAHLWKLRSLGIEPIYHNSYIHIPKRDDENAARLLGAEGIGEDFIIVAPGAKSHLKRWPEDSYAQLSDRIASEAKVAVVFTGLGEESDTVENISKKMRAKSHNLANRTGLRELAALLRRARLLITNDSAPLHLACAVGCKVLALFGPTDSEKYGPTGYSDRVIFKKLACSPCESALCKFDRECMRSIAPDEVFDMAMEMLRQ
jgi:ADP-heptose:LPS heptosyltransferase